MVQCFVDCHRIMSMRWFAYILVGTVERLTKVAASLLMVTSLKWIPKITGVSSKTLAILESEARRLRLFSSKTRTSRSSFLQRIYSPFLWLHFFHLDRVSFHTFFSRTMSFCRPMYVTPTCIVCCPHICFWLQLRQKLAFQFVSLQKSIASHEFFMFPSVEPPY